MAAVPMTMRVLMTSALFMLVRVRRRFACRLCAPGMKLAHFPFFAAKRVHHPDGAQPFLRLGQNGALLLPGSRSIRVRMRLREKINRAEEKGNDDQRQEG